MAKDKSATMTVRIWRAIDKYGRECIKMASSEDRFTITTINEREGSERCHKNLHMKLRRVLESHSKW